MPVTELPACTHLDAVAPVEVITDEGHDDGPTVRVDHAHARNRRDGSGRNTQEDKNQRSAEYRNETSPQEDQSARLRTPRLGGEHLG